MKSSSLIIPQKATEEYFFVVQFAMRYRVVLNLESADEILWFVYSNESL